MASGGPGRRGRSPRKSLLHLDELSPTAGNYLAWKLLCGGARVTLGRQQAHARKARPAMRGHEAPIAIFPRSGTQ